MAFRQDAAREHPKNGAVTEPQRRRKAFSGSTLRAAAPFARVLRCSSVTDRSRICFLLTPCAQPKFAAANA
ncbi:MAG: hypothetical protein DME55_06340 [Verrucomicrobia bacterium]|nr:MAG: hypothetical protein DME55_06340 [Verrucomicrobiota bacterium]